MKTADYFRIALFFGILAALCSMAVSVLDLAAHAASPRELTHASGIETDVVLTPGNLIGTPYYKTKPRTCVYLLREDVAEDGTTSYKYVGEPVCVQTSGANG